MYYMKKQVKQTTFKNLTMAIKNKVPLEIIKDLINSGENVNNTTSNGLTPLFYAMNTNNYDYIHFLIKNGADCNSRNAHQWTPLMVLLENNLIDSSFVERVINGLPQHVLDYNKDTLLLLGCKYGLEHHIEAFILMGAQVNEQDYTYGNTPLIWCVKNNCSINILKRLLERGANPNTSNKQNHTVLTYALALASTSVIELLKRYGVNPYFGQSLNGNTMIVYKGIQEDTTSYQHLITNHFRIQPHENYYCKNNSFTTLEPYDTHNKDLLIFYLPNVKSNLFDNQGICMLRSELFDYMNIDYSKNNIEVDDYGHLIQKPPKYVQALWTKGGDINGRPGQATTNLIFLLPPYGIYITLGSLRTILRHKEVKEWFLVPLYGGMTRRVGNIASQFGRSMNHGQLPGYMIYKVYTKKQLQGNKLHVKESKNEFIIPGNMLMSKFLSDVHQTVESFIDALLNRLLKYQ